MSGEQLTKQSAYIRVFVMIRESVHQTNDARLTSASLVCLLPSHHPILLQPDGLFFYPILSDFGKAIAYCPDYRLLPFVLVTATVYGDNCGEIVESY